MRLREKIMWIVLIGILLIVLVIKPAYTVIVEKIQQPRFEKIEFEYQTKKNYEMQNLAFSSIKYNNSQNYISYDKFDEKELQISLNAYNFINCANITLEEIKEFLDQPLNTDGSAKTYVDASESVQEYVEWYNGNSGRVILYRDDLDNILDKYRENHPNCQYEKLRDLPIEELNELCSYYNGSVDDYPYDQLHEEWKRYNK